jgi:hypothetical protein
MRVIAFIEEMDVIRNRCKRSGFGYFELDIAPRGRFGFLSRAKMKFLIRILCLWRVYHNSVGGDDLRRKSKFLSPTPQPARLPGQSRGLSGRVRA